MWIVPFKSESSDHYVIGPFDHKPTTEEILEVFEADNPDEGSYVRDCIADGMYGDSPFTPRQLPSGGPGVIQTTTHTGPPCSVPR
jgi:hypothetical protein